MAKLSELIHQFNSILESNDDIFYGYLRLIDLLGKHSEMLENLIANAQNSSFFNPDAIDDAVKHWKSGAIRPSPAGIY